MGNVFLIIVMLVSLGRLSNLIRDYKDKKKLDEMRGRFYEKGLDSYIDPDLFYKAGTYFAIILYLYINLNSLYFIFN